MRTLTFRPFRMGTWFSIMVYKGKATRDVSRVASDGPLASSQLASSEQSFFQPPIKERKRFDTDSMIYGFITAAIVDMTLTIAWNILSTKS